MILQVFSIFDSNIKAYMPPFFVNHRGEATRGFEELANDSKTNICKYAQDFFLFELGVFDNASGEFTLLTNPNSLGCALTFKKQSSVSNLDPNLDPLKNPA